MNKPENINEKGTLNSLENLSDEELVALKNQAIADEDYDKAKMIKQEQETRKQYTLKLEKESFSTEKNKKLKILLSELNKEEGAEITESMAEDFWKICEKFREAARSISKAREASNINTKYDREFYYKLWQELYVYLKNFCSWYGDNIYDNPEKNNNIIIKKLWLKEEFNNVYRRICTLGDWYHKWEIAPWKYYLEIYDMFINMEDTIKHSKDPWFYAKWEDGYMPML